MTPEQAQTFLALAVGFAFAGMLVSGYQAATSRRPSLRILSAGWSADALAAMPFLALAAPILIMRSAVQPEREAKARFLIAMTCTIVAGSWSILSGTLLVSALRALLAF